MIAGNQVPEIPLGEVVFKGGADCPLHKFKDVLKLGIIFESIVTSNVTGVAHCPTFGVKTYLPFAVLLMVAGDQVPTIPLGEVVFKAETVSPEQ